MKGSFKADFFADAFLFIPVDTDVESSFVDKVVLKFDIFRLIALNEGYVSL